MGNETGARCLGGSRGGASPADTRSSGGCRCGPSDRPSGDPSMGRQPWHGQAPALAGQMTIQWTSKASSHLVRLHEHLSPVAPEPAARVDPQLAYAPDRLPESPRIGEKPEEPAPRAVSRTIAAQYD